jgi:hypothetical protein
MSSATEEAIETLVALHPELAPVLTEHVEDNEGEVLPHLVMADVVRWLVAHRNTDPAACRSIMRWMEERFHDGPDEVRGMIAVSGVEMIPDPGQPGAELREWLGPALREIDPWR